MKLYVWFKVRGYCMLNIQYVENSVFSAIVNFLNFCIIFFSMISINSLFLNIEFLEMRMGIIFFRGFIFFFRFDFFYYFYQVFFQQQGNQVQSGYYVLVLFQGEILLFDRFGLFEQIFGVRSLSFQVDYSGRVFYVVFLYQVIDVQFRDFLEFC